MLVALAVFVAGSSHVAEALAAADSTVLQVNPRLIMAPTHTSLQAVRAICSELVSWHADLCCGISCK